MFQQSSSNNTGNHLNALQRSLSRLAATAPFAQGSLWRGANSPGCSNEIGTYCAGHEDAVPYGAPSKTMRRADCEAPACKILQPVRGGGRKRPALRRMVTDCGFARGRQYNRCVLRWPPRASAPTMGAVWIRPGSEINLPRSAGSSRTPTPTTEAQREAPLIHRAGAVPLPLRGECLVRRFFCGSRLRILFYIILLWLNHARYNPFGRMWVKTG